MPPILEIVRLRHALPLATEEERCRKTAAKVAKQDTVARDDKLTLAKVIRNNKNKTVQEVNNAPEGRSVVCPLTTPQTLARKRKVGASSSSHEVPRLVSVITLFMS